MLSAAEIKRVKSLWVKKFRDESGLFAVEGEKMVAEALASSFEVVKVYRESEIGSEAMARISQTASPSPALAIVRKPSPAPLSLTPSSGLFLGLDAIRDPGNLGTIMRIADWFGADGLFASPDTVEFFNPKAVQSTMGAIFRLPFQTADIRALASSFLSADGQVYGTFLDGENIYGSPLALGDTGPVLILIGNESRGLSPDIPVSGRLLIPPFPASRHGSESLNAAVATAITVAEFRRRAGQ